MYPQPMVIDSRERPHCCQYVYDWVSARSWLGAAESFLNEKVGALGTGREAATIGRKAKTHKRVLALRPWLEPVVDEEKGSPVAWVTVDRMVQERELGIPQGLGF